MPLSDDFLRGAWFAFDEVLGWINTQDTQLIDKRTLYKAVFALRPASRESKAAEA